MNRLDEFKKRASEVPPTDDIPIDEKDARHIAIRVNPSPEPKESPEDQKMEMSVFFEQVREIEGHIKKIHSYTEQIEKQHATAINSTNEEEKALCSQKLEQLVSGLTQSSNYCRATLKSIDAKTNELAPIASKGSGSLRMRQVKQRQLVDSFTSEMKKFKKMQERYNEKYKVQLERQVKIVNPQVTKEEMKQILEDPEGARQMIFDIGKKQAAQKDLQQMKDRFEDVKKIAESIQELQQMFLEMDEMITAQGDVINRIENSVDNVEDFTEEAKKDLESAVESQKSILKKKWYLMALVAFLVIFLLFVLAYVVRTFKFW